MKTCKEKALEWNVSPRSVNDMCKKGRIQGAIKEKGSWLIPDDSPKPMDIILIICDSGRKFTNIFTNFVDKNMTRYTNIC